MSAIRRLVLDQHGATAIEYSVIVGLIAAVLITAMTNVGQKIVELLAPISNLT
jgi:Flp pilus assembly pilin Flp